MSRRFAIVTGSSSGIGLALARRMLDAGWEILGIARRAAAIEHEAYTELQIDLADSAALKSAAEERIAPLLARDDCATFAVVNNAAAIGSLARLSETDPAVLARLFAVNSVAPMYLSGLAAAHVPADVKLRIVNISSGAAHSPFAGLGDYSATKAALRLAGRTQALELQEAGRTPQQAAVFSFEPGVVATDMQVRAREADPEVFPAQAAFRDFHEQGLLHAPGAVVDEIIAFCAGDPDESFTESRYGG